MHYVAILFEHYRARVLWCTIVHMKPSDLLRRHIADGLAKSGMGLHRYEAENGLPKWSLRGIMDPARQQSPTLDRAAELCSALGLDFYLGPPRTPDNLNESPVHSEKPPAILTFSDVDLPVNGRAACGLDAQKHRRHREKAEDDLPEPVGLTDDVDAFYAIADGSSMVPEGIHPGDYCVVSPNTPLAVGQRLWMEDANGARRIKRLMGFSDTELTLRGWGEPGSGAVGSVNERVQREYW